MGKHRGAVESIGEMWKHIGKIVSQQRGKAWHS